MLGPRGPRLSLSDTSWTFRLKTLATSQFSKNASRPQCPSASNLVCAQNHSEVRRRATNVVGLGGLEPPASPLSGVRSNHLSYRPKSLACWCGGACRDRTDDPLLAKQVLSQLSYSPVFAGTLARAKTGRSRADLSINRNSECRSLVRTSGQACAVFCVSKGGDPAAPSDTATLL